MPSDLLKGYTYITDAIDEIDSLIEKANGTRNRKEKHSLLTKAQSLIDAYEEHCSRGGNTKKQFKDVL
jgi:hypothetical protein